MRRFLLTIFALLLLAAQVCAAPGQSSGETEAELNTDCVVAGDGSCDITLQAVIRFADGTEDFAIPLPASAEKITLTGADYRTKRDGDCILLCLQGIYSGTVRLTVTYQLPDNVRSEGGVQEFSLTLLSPRWSCIIRRYAFQVQFPKPFDGMPSISSGYRQELIENYLNITIGEGSVKASLLPNEVLNDHDEMSIRLTVPEDYFDLRFVPGRTAKVAVLLFLMLCFVSFVYWLLFLRGRPILPKRQAMPPEGGNAGEIPYLLAESRPDLALMVVHWASLGYLTIHRSKTGKIYLMRQIDMGNERKSYEVAVFRSLFSRGDRCDANSGEYLRTKDSAADRAREYWGSRVFRQNGEKVVILRLLAVAAGLALCVGCFDAALPAVSWRWFLVIPLALLGGAACWALQQLGGCMLRRHALRTILLALASLVYLLVAGKKAGMLGWLLLCVLFQLLVGGSLRCGGPRTKAGSALASELLGYRRYLLSAPSSVFRGNLRADPQYFYRSLPYADALLVGKLFAAGFDNSPMEPCDWLDWEGRPSRTAMGFYARYRRLMAGLRGEREPAQYRPKPRKRS